MRFPTGPILELEQYFALLDYTTEVRNEALYGPTAERVLPEWVSVACDVLDMDTKQLSSCDSFIWVGDEEQP